MTLLHFARALSGTPAGAGGGGDWQLATGHYEPSKDEPEIIFPRSDANSGSAERHRLTPDGRRWSIPVSMYSGAWPFYYSVDATSAAKGISIGAQLTESGDVLVVGDSYAELSWSNPTIGSHVITVTVRTQEYGRNSSGFGDEKSVTFTLVVVDKNDTTKFVWLSGAGNDTTGDGSFDLPFRSLSKIFSTSAYSGRQLHMLAGTYDTDAAAQLGVNDSTPATIVADDGAAVTINYTQRNFQLRADGCYIQGIATTEDGYGTTVADERLTTIAAAVDKWTYYRCNFQSPSNGTAGTDNPTSIFAVGGASSTARLNCVISRCSESGRASTSNSGGLFILFACDAGVAEFNTVTGNPFYALVLKDSNRRWSVRANSVIKTSAGNGFGPAIGCQLQSYTTEDIELSYNKTNAEIRCNYQAVSTTGVHHVFRNSGSDSISILNSNTVGTGPYNIDKNAVEGTITSGTQVVSTNTECVAASGVLDASLNLEGTYRTNYLGARAAEVA